MLELNENEVHLSIFFGRNHGISVYKKALKSEHGKNYIFRDNNCLVKMSEKKIKI